MSNHKRIKIYQLSVFESVFHNINQKLPKRVVKLLIPPKKRNKPINIKTNNISKISNKEITSDKNILQAPSNFNKEDLIKKINSYLNKLSNKNLETMNKNILLLLNSEYIINNTIDFILDKAISQHTFIKLYSYILNSISIENNLTNIYEKYFNEHISSLKNGIVSTDSEYDNFCTYLNNKNKLIGLYFLLIELYKLDNLKLETIIKYLNVLTEFIDAIDENDLIETYTECLCKSITLLENKVVYNLLTNKLKEYTNNKNKFKSRIRFMIMDLNDFYKK